MNLLKNFPQIETDRLLLREFSLEKDLNDYASIMAENEVGRWLPKGRGYTKDETIKFMEFIRDHWEKHGFGIWAVTDKATGSLLGHCGLNYIESLKEVEVLYALGFNGRGKGFCTEAAKASLDFAFSDLKMNHIIALAKSDNGPSKNVMEKLGLKYTKDIEIFNMNCVYYEISFEYNNIRN